MFKISGEILQIQGNRVMWYSACQECKKKIMPSGGEDPGLSSDLNAPPVRWYCDRCAKHFDKCNWTYNFSIRIGDSSDSVYAQCLGESPGSEIMGMQAQELRALAEQDPSFQGW